MQYVYGPIPSRRLGQSLGIDLIPLKTCNWNCVYCQLGRSVPLTNERKEYAPRAEVLAEARAALAAHPAGAIDWVSFVGSGEPTLHSGIGWLIREVQAGTDRPVAVITNGSLLHLPEVRRDLATADAVLPTLDAGTPELYRRLNRPHPDVTFERIVEGLSAFRAGYTGRLWVEVMLIRGANDTEEALEAIAAVLRPIGPDAIHVNLPIRPPAETWVEPPDEAGLERATRILGGLAQVVQPAQGIFDLSGGPDLIDAIVSVITRHPMRQDELERALARWAPGHVRQALAELAVSGRAQKVERHGVRFWGLAHAHFPDEAHSARTDPRTT